MNIAASQLEAFEALKVHAANLQTLSEKPCNFAHENCEEIRPTECSAKIKKIMLGCAHGYDDVLIRTIKSCVDADLLTSERAEAMYESLYDSANALIRLDIIASDEYDKNFEVSRQTMQSQVDVIARKAAIRDELLTIIRSSVF